jgi:hypothetical protein
MPVRPRFKQPKEKQANTKSSGKKRRKKKKKNLTDKFMCGRWLEDVPTRST